MKDSIHFELVKLADGVHAALHREGGAASSNSGILDLGDQALVFDTCETVCAADDLRAAVIELTGRPARWVVNSHAHGDHWTGNQVFEVATVIATRPTRDGMAGELDEIRALQRDLDSIRREIAEQQEQLEAETDPLRRAGMQGRLSRLRFTLEDMPRFVPRLPDQTFDGKLALHGSTRIVELVAAPPAHTPGDAYLLLPDEGIIFTGDLCFFDQPPYVAANCDIPNWIDLLDQFQAADYETFVPGHGAVGKKANLKREQEYLLAMLELAGRAVKARKTLEQVLALPLPEAFRDWEPFFRRHQNNLRSLYTKLAA
jgi:glyoxylase-like metal-dependent hydrolase (beta-lactamase superfamily II)